ncbi:polycystic kidney disease protein 1-like 2 isoform X2 [Echeneis naucrates]|uniref:polycystic kidney disease protein 1-like 2 isoform X2 n=1 Tax=Echeneis naucrates TaxID=173247 RepID=UPI001113965A|nr:polycystic kidney disease protein 1-like 2 isoform X2 [Echeneis naucrates]
MLWTVLQLVILVTHSHAARNHDESRVTVSCPEYQMGFGGSCYQLVAQRQSSFSAEAWCEEHGGHLAFIPNKDTQQFLQKYLDPEEDMWLGVAPPISPNSESAPGEGALSWLDGSPITYSNWGSNPQPGAACGYILKNSGFRWEATTQCNKKLHFICQFESGRFIVCRSSQTTLQCGSGQVLIIDSGFYGRKNVHYCRAAFSPPTTATQCGWVDVGTSVAAHCHGSQSCQLADIVKSFDEPCPELGSYLSLDYHCKNGLKLTVSTVAAVFDNITIKWLLTLSSGNISCRLRTGDGRVTYLDSSPGLENIMVHQYTYPSSFVVAVECRSNDTHITAQRTITILEPVTGLSVTGCYSGKLSFNASYCRALNGDVFKIQTEVKAGSNVTYRIQNDEVVLSGLSVVRGNVPHNITVTPDVVRQLGPGCHQLIINASNNVTFPDVSTDLQLCVFEEVAGLQVSVLAEREDQAEMTVAVSLERGWPVVLIFSLTGDDSVYESREMNLRKGTFHLKKPARGTVQLELCAKNVFSSQEVDVDMFSLSMKNSAQNVLKDNYISLKKKQQTSHIRVVRTPAEIHTPVHSVSSKLERITLNMTDEPKLTDGDDGYHWTCKNPCKCQGQFQTLVYTIEKNCLPDPFEFYKYDFNVIEDDDKKNKKSVCITLTPRLGNKNWLSLSCIRGCDRKKNRNTEIKMDCKRKDLCSEVVWNIEDPRDSKKWPKETKNCYESKMQRPLIEKMNGGTEYTVKLQYLALAGSKNEDLIVVVTYGGNQTFYSKYTIKTSSSTGKPSPKPGEHSEEDATITSGSGAKGPNTFTSKPVIKTIATSKRATSPLTTKSPGSFSCSISPSNGTIFTAFSITCKTVDPCPHCRYCFKTGGKHLRCSKKNEVKSVFLPLGKNHSNHKLMITATAKHKSFVVSTTIITQVEDCTGDSESVDGLKMLLDNGVTELKKQGLLSGESVGQIVNTVSKKVNDQYNKTEKVYRQKLREEMLHIMIDTVKKVPVNSPEEVQVVAGSLTAIVQRGTELSSSAQEDASLLFANLSASLLDLDLDNSEENIKEIYTAASNIVEGISTILSYSSSKNISDSLLVALDNTLSALLIFKDPDAEPITIQHANISVLVNRMTPGRLQKDVNIPNSSSSTFSLPDLPSNIFPSEEPVDIRMLSLNNNPFSWNERANISGQIAALSFTKTDGSSISVENLSKEIEILLPRPIGEQVETSVFDLGNFSTTVIDIHSTDSTLVLKMVPSKDPLPFKLFLGYLSYPTTTKYVAMTEMPHQGNTEEERYTWLLDPKSLKGNTGVHYLVVRPIVGPGIKSINASLSITSFTAACKFWNESTLDWSDTGCRVGPQTTQFFTQCLCNHLTFFGSSFFVTPNLIDPSRSAELFGTFAENPVVVCFVGSLFAAYLLVLVWARRKDIQDTAKVNVTVLVDNDPMDKYCYLISVSTGHRRGASTSSQVTVTLLGADGNSEPHHLTDQKKSVFERGAVDWFLLTTPLALGDLWEIRLWHNNSGGHPSWYVSNVTVQDLQTNQKWHFLCNSWLSIDIDDCCLDKVFPVSTEMDLKKFRNVFFMKTTKDFSDGHLWYSVISRPPNSTFTCVQRVSCCFSLLLCTMLTSIMFYGHFEFTLQQFMIGVQSSLIMFPVNILIVSIFRNTHPWDMSCCKNKTKKPDALEQEKNLRTPSPQIATANINVTLDTIIKDITRIAHSLSTTMKSNIPCTMSEFGPGQQIDINAILSVVEDFIKQNNKTSESTQSETQLPEDSLRVQPGTEMEGNQKKSNKAQYLYLLLCHIDKELSLLGSSGFPSPHSYSQALQQVQGMKRFLEDLLFTSSCIHLDEPTQNKLTCADGDSGQKKKGYCHEGLPWWFIFIGWLLVIATSVVSGFFTMLYGLKFGKERSISWLVSMIVSFFQSILVIQPLKVLSLALFFALVIKKVDEEECKNVPFLRNNSNLGDCTGQQIFRRDKNLYEPPPPADIEKIKRNKMMEQKAFALLREILTYSCFIWMLLLVAYSQRDPNAFFLNQHIRDSFSEGISDSMSLDDVFKWLNTSLLGNLFGVYPGFITDGNSKLVGFARLRQLRVQKNSCEFADSVLQFVPDCHALYSREAEDTGSYGNAWNLSVMGNISTGTSSPWRYQTQAQLRAPPVWGKIMLYRGGGFVTELGPDMQNASSTLGYLYRSKWLDVYTQAFFVEFTVYNANVNLFCIVTLMFETSAVGAFQFRSELQSIRLYQSTGGFHIFVMAAEIIYMLFILYYMFLQGKLLKQQRWAYFRNKWNLLELAIILLSWSAMAIFIRRTLLGDRDMAYYQNHKDQFASFYESAMADLILQRLIAFLTLLATVKLWRLLRLNPNMNMITATLQRAWGDISGFLVIIVIAFLAYSIVCNMIYGWRISSYHTLADALLTIICLQIGIFNYDEVLDHNLLLGGLLFGSCIIMVTFVLLNILISVILGAFKQEQIHHKPSEEEEIVRLLLKKICSLFGIIYKDSIDSQGSEMSDSRPLTLNNRRILPDSSFNVKHFEISDNTANT